MPSWYLVCIFKGYRLHKSFIIQNLIDNDLFLDGLSRKPQKQLFQKINCFLFFYPSVRKEFEAQQETCGVYFSVRAFFIIQSTVCQFLHLQQATRLMFALGGYMCI